jgi:hypothetical protein
VDAVAAVVEAAAIDTKVAAMHAINATWKGIAPLSARRVATADRVETTAIAIDDVQFAI